MNSVASPKEGRGAPTVDAWRGGRDSIESTRSRSLPLRRVLDEGICRRGGGAVTLSTEEAIVPLRFPRHRVPPVSRFRSTWLTSSLRALRSRGRYEEYLARLPPHHRELVQTAIAGLWLPIDVAVVHYEACQSLGFTPSEQFDIGREVTRFALNTSYSVALRMAREAGVTPWSCFALQGKLWEQVWSGGAVGVFKVGPKEARVELHGWPCAKVPYCRNALRGLLVGQTELFSTKAYAREIPTMCVESSLGFRVSWV